MAITICTRHGTYILRSWSKRHLTCNIVLLLFSSFYRADETNVPPVRAEEILQTWNALFEIAKAIRHVHHLEVPRGGGGEPRRFHGYVHLLHFWIAQLKTRSWHADIKPDNILSIRGRLKLSDFGFSSFAPVIREHARSAPTEFIKGFTDTYGERTNGMTPWVFF